MSIKPPTMEEAEARGLLAKKGIYTFSNGSHWECWASGNCFECWYYQPEDSFAESRCAFEAAGMLGMVSPALALLFGWTESPTYPGSFDEPDQCAFFRDRTDDRGEDNPPPPEPDPLQLVLLADPTEDAHIIAATPAPELFCDAAR